MIEHFTGSDEHKYPSLFSQMYRQRYEIYVKRRRWDLQPLGELEKDQYDTPDANYLIVVDDTNRILASLRLLKTTQPHIFGDLFADLAGEAGVPVGEQTLELTRFYVAPFGAGKELRQWLIGVLSAGMIEYCLENKIRYVSSVIDSFLLPLMHSMKWPVRQLGARKRYEQGIALGVKVDMTEQALRTTQLSKNVPDRVLSTSLMPVPRIPAQVRSLGLRALAPIAVVPSKPFPRSASPGLEVSQA